MRFFGPAVTALVTIGFFAHTTFSAPQRHQRPPPGTGPTGTTSSFSGSSSSSGSTTSSVSTSSSSGSDTVKPGTGSAGQATVVNNCTFPAYVYVCKQHPATCGATSTIDAGKTYSEAYAPSADGGHSLKISVTSGSGDILQFEYTNGGNGEVSYDLSEVNGNPFGTWGFSLTNTTTDVFCAPPATDCPAIFTQPTNGIPYTAPTSDGVGAILCG